MENEKNTVKKKTNLQMILDLYPAAEVADCIGVSHSTIDRYRLKGFLASRKQMDKLAELDSHFTSDDFMNDYIEAQS